MLLGCTKEAVMDHGILSKDFPHTIPFCHSYPVVHLSTKHQVWDAFHMNLQAYSECCKSFWHGVYAFPFFFFFSRGYLESSLSFIASSSFQSDIKSFFANMKYLLVMMHAISYLWRCERVFQMYTAIPCYLLRASFWKVQWITGQWIAIFFSHKKRTVLVKMHSGT